MGPLKIIALIGVVTLIACGPGPLPSVGRPAAGRADRFPSQSDEPWPLDLAIRSDDLEEVRALLKKGANPNERWGQSGDHHPLQEAFDTGNGYPVSNRLELVHLLLEHGADPNARWCPFESRGYREWGPGCTSMRGTTALIFAAMFDSVELVEVLLDAGADASMRDHYNGSALDYAYDGIVFEEISRSLFPSLKTRDQQALAWLAEYEGRFYGSNPWESTPLSRALSQTDAGFVPPPPPPDGSEASYRAERERRVLNRVLTLLRIGADPNERATRAGADWPPLAMALRQGAFRVARLLLQNGANPNQRWCMPFFFAPYGNSVHGTRQAKAPGCAPENGMTALMWSVEFGPPEAVELLLEFAADVSLKDWAGRSAADVARTGDIRRLIEGRSATAAPPPSR